MYDVIIIGAGASGLFCAAILSRSGLRIAIAERRERPARKLMVTGKGRCNLCNNCDVSTLVQNTVRGGRFLQSAFHALPPQEIMQWFTAHGVTLKTERGGRVFPQSDQARDVVDALINTVKKANVQLLHATVKDLIVENGSVKGVVFSDGKTLYANAVVVATGGLSYPLTGSTGDGYRFARECGHTIISPAPALISLITKENYPAQAMGLSLRNVELSLYDSKKPKKPIYQELGELMMTHFGISGPLALTASSYLDSSRPADYYIRIDLKPALDFDTLDRRLLRDFEMNKNRDFSNGLDALLPHSLIPIIVSLSEIPPQQKIHSITREQRYGLIRLLKSLTLHIKALGPIEEAIITRGGVKTSEINPKTMQSKLIKNLFFIGEVIDADALTGGFNLQIAFSTAYLAACALSENKYENEVKK